MVKSDNSWIWMDMRLESVWCRNHQSEQVWDLEPPTQRGVAAKVSTLNLIVPVTSSA